MNNFNKLYKTQVDFQQLIVYKGSYKFEVEAILPADNIDGFSYHIQQLISEIGEVLSSDKRWKSHRNKKLDVENKKEEIADCFIVLMNVAIFSGFEAEEIYNMIETKQKENVNRLNK
ncbi:hypothetical protein [Clostridium sp.]|uniref:hypothetical protein n=1 Tax=Clostridium sp. TaxID=1506 RepID=UPI001A5CC6CC|nr:hypothetical protein [Clostridium sp.]MBK5234069.1 hypothetical protein [Clostridium sp.]